MYFIFGSLITLTIAESFLVGFGFLTLILIIARGLYAMRMMGVKVSKKAPLVTEGISVLWTVVSPIVFKSNFTLKSTVFAVICSLIVLAIEWVDSTYYIYVEEESD